MRQDVLARQGATHFPLRAVLGVGQQLAMTSAIPPRSSPSTRAFHTFPHQQVRRLLKRGGRYDILLSKYEQGYMGSFIEDNHNVRLCPSAPWCGSAIQVWKMLMYVCEGALEGRVPEKCSFSLSIIAPRGLSPPRGVCGRVVR